MPTGDKQLWRVSDIIDGVEFGWPIYVTPVVASGKSEAVLVESAIPFQDERQYQFVLARIGERAFDSESNRWLVRPKIITKIAKKCDGVTPEFYIKWPGVDDPVLEKIPSTRDQAVSEAVDEDFVRYCCAERGLGNIAQTRLLYNIICYNAVRWMLEMHKPLNLGFCTIHALPYRVNWKGILHSRDKNLLSTLRLSKEVRDGVMAHEGWTNAPFSRDLMEMCDGNTFGWTLEIIQSSAFDKEVLRVEKESLSRCEKPVQYVTRWRVLISKQYETILSILKAYLEKASHPLAHLDQSLPEDLWRFVPRFLRGRVRPVVPAVPAAPLVAMGADEVDPLATPETNDFKDADMPDMSDDGSLEFNLREDRGEG